MVHDSSVMEGLSKDAIYKFFRASQPYLALARSLGVRQTPVHRLEYDDGAARKLLAGTRAGNSLATCVNPLKINLTTRVEWVPRLLQYLERAQ